MKKTYINKFMAIVSISAITLGVISCGDPELPTPVPATEAATSSANIRFINASPDAPSLNFSVNNVSSATGVAYNAISNYAKTPVGQASVRGTAASGDIGGTLGKNAILFRATATSQNNFTFANGASYTFIVMDSIARPKPTTTGATNPGGPQLLNFTDNNSAPPAGKAKVRIVNAVAGEGSLWVTKAAGVEFAGFNGTADATTGKTPGIAIRAASSFVNVDPGTVTMEFRTASNAGTVRKSGDVTFAAGKIYTIVLTGKRVANTTVPVKVPYTINVYQYN